MKKIYLIGSIPKVIDDFCEVKFYKTQMQLAQIGFEVINPIERLSDKSLSLKEATRKNFQDLMLCDGIYIMPCFSYENAKNNIELKWAIKFNLITINGFVDVTSDKNEIIKVKTNKRKKTIVK